MRGAKLNKIWKGPLNISSPHRNDIEGVILGKALGDQRINRFTTKRNGERYECPVEEVALDHYIQKEGYREGVHAEGAVWHTMFGLLCYDIIFDPEVKDVWFSETQSHPADLNTKVFYTVRKSAFDARFEQIEASKYTDLVKTVVPVYEKHYGETNNEISWECFADLDQIKVVEVKGPGDKLSTKQILWLQYFKEHHVTAHVCHVTASHPKRMS